MVDQRIEKLADVIVNYSTVVQPGDRVFIHGNIITEPLIREVYAKVLQAGGHPLIMTQLSGTNELLYSYASEKQLAYVPEPVKVVFETYEVIITILGTENTKALTNVDPQKMVLLNKSQAELGKTMMQRISDGSLRWLGTEFPTNAGAQDAEMSLREFENLVYGACLPDMNDPVRYWKRFSVKQAKIVDWFKGKEEIRVVGPETDVRLSIAGRTFLSADGRQNMPDGEVYTSPVENSIEGHVYFSYPAIYRDREVSGVRLWFEQGRVVKATAERGEDFLHHILDTDEGARYVGEFAIGTHTGITNFTRSILFDEKIGGSFHMALGAGFAEIGGTNESAIHWDMICDLRGGGEIWVDDELLHKDGQFVVEF